MSQKFFLIFPENYPAKDIAISLGRELSALSGVMTVNDFKNADFILAFDLSEKTQREISEIISTKTKTSLKFVFYFLEEVDNFARENYLNKLPKKTLFMTAVPSNLDFAGIFLPTGVDEEFLSDEISNTIPVITIASNSIPRKFSAFIAAISEINSSASGMPITISDKKPFEAILEDLTEKNIPPEKINALKFSANGVITDVSERKNLFGTSFVNIVPFNENTTDTELREVLLSGGFTLAQNNPFIKTAGIPGRDFETFETPEELVDKINFFAQNPSIANRIRENAILNLPEHLSSKTCAERLQKLVNNFKY